MLPIKNITAIKKELHYNLEDEFDNMIGQLKYYGGFVKHFLWNIKSWKMNDICDEYRESELKKGKQGLNVELKIPMDRQEWTNSIYINVVKIGRSWYLIGM